MTSISKLLILFCLYVGYVMHTYSRRSFQNVINYTIKEEFLSTESIGMVVSAQQIGYTVCKFTQPFIIDRVNPSLSFTLTMLSSFVAIMTFSYSTSFYEILALYWFHGFCLAFAWPSLAKVLKQIIPQNEFGLWWSIQCTSSNTGAIIGAIASTFVSDRYGWRKSLQVCALINLTCFFSIAVVFLVTPIPILIIDNKIQNRYNTLSLSYFDFLLNPLLLANNLMFFCVYICRYTISDWYQIHLSLMQFPQYQIASFISFMEIGGTLGSLVAGITADYMLVNFQEWKNPRVFVIIVCGVLSAMTLHMLIFSVNQDTTQFKLVLVGFLFGLFIYGPVAVSGIVAIEGAPPQHQGMSLALNIIFANVAMLLTGYPVSYLGQKFGWKRVFMMSYFSICASTLILFLYRNAASPIHYIDSSESQRTASLNRLEKNSE